MRLPRERLLQLIVDQSDPSKDVPEIAVLCHHCKQIEKYSLAENSSGHVGAGRLEPLDRTVGLNLLLWLKCADYTCTSRLPLLETWSQATSPEVLYDRRIANIRELSWSDLLCANGHPIRYPQM